VITDKKRRQHWCWRISLSDETEKLLVIGAYSIAQEWKLIYLSIDAIYGWTPQIVDSHKQKISCPRGAPEKGAFVIYEGKVLKF